MDRFEAPLVLPPGSNEQDMLIAQDLIANMARRGGINELRKTILKLKADYPDSTFEDIADRCSEVIVEHAANDWKARAGTADAIDDEFHQRSERIWPCVLRSIAGAVEKEWLAQKARQN